MTGPPGDQADPEGLTFAQDRLGINVHGNADSHIDALCHIMYRKSLYNDVSADAVTSDGAEELSIEETRDGIAGRGVLLDIPRLHGVPWLEPGELVTAEDLARAADAQQVSVSAGDLLFVRVGHRRRRTELGPWDTAHKRAGLHPAALEFVAEHQVAVLGSDSNSDGSPSAAEGVEFPAHVLAINALGVHLLDYLQFEELVPLCETARRWSFFCVIAPLRLSPGPALRSIRSLFCSDSLIVLQPACLAAPLAGKVRICFQVAQITTALGISGDGEPIRRAAQSPHPWRQGAKHRFETKCLLNSLA